LLVPGTQAHLAGARAKYTHGQENWMFRGLATLFAIVLLLLGRSGPAAAEASTLRAAKQYGLGYLQYMLMEDQKLVEKYAKAAGIGDVTVQWNTFRSSDVMNDALISGSVEFVSLGVPGLMTIWDRTKGNIDVKGASGLNALPIALMVRDDTIKSLKDFTEQHRIAMPAVRVSNQAILLQMACEKEFGVGQHNKLDTIAITMAHPDATIAMISGSRDVTANFSSVPFQNRQAKVPGIRRLMTSTDILGAPFSFNIVATTSKFRTENPKLYKAYLDALNEATEIVNKDKRLAAETYLRMANDKTPIEEILALLNDPEHIFTTKVTPIDSMIQFMVRTGNYKNKPTSAAELLFPEAQQ
jgi:NitT/TauT family transport system substrate-binding protein